MYRADLEAAQAKLDALTSELERTKRELEDARAGVIAAPAPAPGRDRRIAALAALVVSVASIAGGVLHATKQRARYEAEAARLAFVRVEEEEALAKKLKLLAARESALGMTIPIDPGTRGFDWVRAARELDEQGATLGACCPKTKVGPITLDAYFTFRSSGRESFGTITGAKGYYVGTDDWALCVNDRLDAVMKGASFGATEDETVVIAHRFHVPCS